MTCPHHHASPSSLTAVYCTRCNSNGRTKLLMKFAAAAHSVGVPNLWDAQALVTIEALSAIMRERMRIEHEAIDSVG